MNNLFNAAYPVKTVKRKLIDVSKPYIDSAILKVIKEKQNLYRKYRKHPITYGEAYRSIRDRVNCLIRNARRLYYRKKFENC